MTSFSNNTSEGATPSLKVTWRITPAIGNSGRPLDDGSMNRQTTSLYDFDTSAAGHPSPYLSRTYDAGSFDIADFVDPDRAEAMAEQLVARAIEIGNDLRAGLWRVCKSSANAYFALPFDHDSRAEVQRIKKSRAYQKNLIHSYTNDELIEEQRASLLSALRDTYIPRIASEPVPDISEVGIPERIGTSTVGWGLRWHPGFAISGYRGNYGHNNGSNIVYYLPVQSRNDQAITFLFDPYWHVSADSSGDFSDVPIGSGAGGSGGTAPRLADLNQDSAVLVLPADQGLLDPWPAGVGQLRSPSEVNNSDLILKLIESGDEEQLIPCRFTDPFGEVIEDPLPDLYFIRSVV